jgi:hypothetical protein
MWVGFVLHPPRGHCDIGRRHGIIFRPAGRSDDFRVARHSRVDACEHRGLVQQWRVGTAPGIQRKPRCGTRLRDEALPFSFSERLSTMCRGAGPLRVEQIAVLELLPPAQQTQ